MVLGAEDLLLAEENKAWTVQAVVVGIVHWFTSGVDKGRGWGGGGGSLDK